VALAVNSDAGTELCSVVTFLGFPQAHCLRNENAFLVHKTVGWKRHNLMSHVHCLTCLFSSPLLCVIGMEFTSSPFRRQHKFAFH